MTTERHRTLRERHLRWAALSSLMGRGVSLVASLASVPLTLGLLGRERYGVWVTVTSLIGWAGLADLGLGNGVTNHLGEAVGREDETAARRVVSSAAVMVTLVSLVLVLAGAIATVVPSWRGILAAPLSVSDGELRGTIELCTLLFLVGFWLSPFDRIYGAYQEAYLLNGFAVATSLVTVGALAVCSLFRPPMTVLVLVLSGIPLLPRLVGVVYQFGWRRPWLRPRFRDYDGTTARRLLQLGTAFLVPQLAAIGVWQMDNIIVAHILGPAAVAVYATAFRLPSTCSSLINLWLAPLWPAYVEAAARHDYEWIRRSHRRYLGRAMAMALTAGAGLVLLGRPVLGFWTRHQVEVSLDLLVPMAIFLPVVTWCTVYSLALNGLGQLRGQMYYGILSAIVNVLLSIILAHRLGLAGVAWATSIAAAVPGILAFFEMRMALARHEQHHAAVSHA